MGGDIGGMKVFDILSARQIYDAHTRLLPLR
jgi:hypothetical protein